MIDGVEKTFHQFCDFRPNVISKADSDQCTDITTAGSSFHSYFQLQRFFFKNK